MSMSAEQKLAIAVNELQQIEIMTNAAVFEGKGKNLSFSYIATTVVINKLARETLQKIGEA